MNVAELNKLVETMNARVEQRRAPVNPYLVGIEAKPARDWAVALFFGALLGLMMWWGV